MQVNSLRLSTLCPMFMSVARVIPPFSHYILDLIRNKANDLAGKEEAKL